MKKFFSLLLVLAVIFGLYFLYENGKCEGISGVGGCTRDTLGSGHTGNSNYKTEVFTVKGVKFKMIKVEGGTFTDMEGHEVAVSTFCIGATEVTQELWTAVMGSNPSHFTSSHKDINNHNVPFTDEPQRPVESFTWNDLMTFFGKLNKLTGKKFRLPTEAEWEFAARGGNKSRGYKYSGSNNVLEAAWFHESCEKKFYTRPVATKALNELGLSDMSGNVEELCSDRHSGHGGGIFSVRGVCYPSSRSTSTCPYVTVGFRLAL